jgi:SAM-dependent methyltransferase
MSSAKVTSAIEAIAKSYPLALVQNELNDVARTSFHIALALGMPDESWRQKSICDIGGGVGSFSVGCRVLGVGRSVLIDDFADAVNARVGADALDTHRKYGVEISSHDVIRDGLRVTGPFDVVTSFDSMEHWHGSPRRLFAEVVRELRPGGRFVLGVPNCVNLRKRLTVPLGYGKWSPFSEWYEPEIFRGHVREPDVDDLRRVAADMGLEQCRILGRNWLGITSPNRFRRTLSRIVDGPLRLRPTLCSDIYLVGHRPI